MARVLFYDSNWVATLRKVKVKDGRVEIDGKEYYVDESKPFLLKTPLGTEPLYFVKWDCVYPAKVETKVDTHLKKTKLKNLPLQDMLRIKKVIDGDKEVNVIEKVVTTQLVFERDKEHTPESLYKSTKLKILGGMLKVKKTISGIVPLIIGFAVGSGIILFMIKLGFLRI